MFAANGIYSSGQSIQQTQQLSLEEYVTRFVDESYADIARDAMQDKIERMRLELPGPVAEKAVRQAILKAKGDPVVLKYLNEAFRSGMNEAIHKRRRRDDDRTVEQKVRNAIERVLRKREIRAQTRKIAQEILDETLGDLKERGLIFNFRQ